MSFCDILDKITGCEETEDIVPSKAKYPKTQYVRIVLDLNSIHTDEELHLPGVFIGISSISGGGSCGIKLNHISGNSIDLREVKEVKGIFQRLYFTSDGVGGSAILYICQSGITTIIPNELTPYSGSVYSSSLNSKNYVRRINDTQHTILNRLKIRNTHAVNGVEFGYVEKDSLPSAADFRTWSYRLVGQDDIEFTEIDIFRVGFCSTVDDAHATLKFFGTKK